METDINAALTGSDAVTVEWTGTEYRIMSILEHQVVQ